MGILTVDNLTYTVDKKKILDRISLDFTGGRIHAIVGHNGAGKSTLAGIIMGLSGYEEYQGRIIFNGKSLEGLPVYERACLGITLGWQEPARYEGLRVQDFITLPAKNKDITHINGLFEQMGMDPALYLNRALDRTLSGGERKKLELISIMAMEPKLVILDEPDSGIDMASNSRIFDSIHLLKEMGTTVVLITHSQTILSHTEYIFIMCSGRITGKGPPEEAIGLWEKECAVCSHQNKPGCDIITGTSS